METVKDRVLKGLNDVMAKRKENLKCLKCESCMWFSIEFLNCKRYDIEKMEYDCNRHMEFWKQI